MITVMELKLIFFLLSFLHGIYGEVTAPPSTAVARGEDVSLVCTSTEAAPVFTWTYATNGQILYFGDGRGTSLERYDNIVLQESTDAQRSILNISAIELEDEGEYLCSTTGTNPPPRTVVTVEVGSVGTMVLIVDRDDSNSPFMYEATCDAIGSKPEETITWILDGVTQTAGINETDPDTSTDPLLFDKRSVFTFTSTIDTYNVQLVCDISGHQVTRFNRQETERVDIHKPPQSESGVIMIDFTINGTELTITCDDTDSEAVPAMNTFYIYMNPNETPIDKLVSDKAVTITEPEERTEFRCEGSNYLGTTMTSQFYGSTPAPPPTTGLSSTQPPTPDTGVTSTTTKVTSTTTKETNPPGANVAAIAGGVVGGIVVIVIIVIAVLYCKKHERYCFEAGGSSSGSSNKPTGRAVGSSNGSEKDVESPLNGVKDVTAEEKTRPEAAPRGHGSIQHTNDNPNQDMYAMVDKKKPTGGGGVGDAPDRGSGPGQNEPGSMLYADLDLSHKAGHTDKHVPKNENDVVVYSSILV